jgi:predicted O-methyltransferase YrrM
MDEQVADYIFSTDYTVPSILKLSLLSLKGRADTKMLEIGSFEGRSAIWFLENILTGSGSSITCVDGFWAPYGDVFDRNIAASGQAHRVTRLTGFSQTILPALADAGFDAIYIDGGHTEREVAEDAFHAWRLAKPGAILIFDDYAWRPELPLEDRPKRAIDRFLIDREGEYHLMLHRYQVIVRKL